MSHSRKKAKGRSDAPGGFAGIPRVVMEHPDYLGLSGGAVKLLMELAYQYKGRSNGNLMLAYSVLRTRGFNSKDTISRATKELLEAGLIMTTREGRFSNPGGVCALYALTWESIDDCPGKDLTLGPTTTPPRKFSLEINKMPSPETGHGSDQKPGRQRVRDDSGRYSSDQKLGRLRVVT